MGVKKRKREGGKIIKKNKREEKLPDLGENRTNEVVESVEVEGTMRTGSSVL